MTAGDVYFILTWWGTLLSAEPEQAGLHQAPLSLGYRANAIPFRIDGTSITSLNESTCFFEIYRDVVDGLVSLKRDGLYLCAGEDRKANISRTKVSYWEKFILLSQNEIEDLLFLLNNDWVERWTKIIARRSQHGVLSSFRVRIGDRTVQLRPNIPITISSFISNNPKDISQPGFLACTIWQDFWKPIELILYRPLVFYCAFGAKALSMISTNLRSLRSLGFYDGDILLLTDASKQHVRSELCEWPESKLHVQNVNAFDYLDFCAARYLVTDWPQARQFQPLLYVDADVIFDLDPKDMFIDLALKGKMSAQREPDGLLGIHDPVGAELFREAGIATGNVLGFNAGIFGITNIERHGHLLKTIRSAIYRYADVKGSRTVLSHFDQSFANYVAFIMDSLDLEICSTHIRWAHSEKIHGGNAPMGMVHFWGVADKQADMEHYLESLLSPENGDHNLPKSYD